MVINWNSVFLKEKKSIKTPSLFKMMSSKFRSFPLKRDLDGHYLFPLRVFGNGGAYPFPSLIWILEFSS